MAELFNNDPALNEANRRLAAQGKPPVKPTTPATSVQEAKTAIVNTDGATASDLFYNISGPLAALEESTKSPNFLKYPQQLGNDSNAAGRYAMRILIYRQDKSPVSVGVVNSQNNPFDRNRKATQQGRVNYSSFAVSDELLKGRAGDEVALILGAKGVKNIVTTALKDVPGLGGLAEGAQTLALINAAESATEYLTGNPNNVRTQPLGYIHLYMPETLNFVDRHDYDAVSVTDALGVQGLLAQGNATEFLGRIGERASVFGINVLGQNFTELALFNSGLALNPQLEVLYRKTNNREFVFNFRFVPSNAVDAQAVEDIIRTLRFHAAPEFQTTTAADGTVQTTSSRYIIPPSQFEIEFITMDKSGIGFNDKLPRIASCVLSNIDVNYAPSGQFSAYAGDYPVETQLQLTFTETIILTKNDVAIGY